MAVVIDYLHAADGDLIIEDGDFKKGDATQAHQKVLMMATKGDFTQSPLTGVGVVEFLLDSVNDDELRHAIQEEFEADGMSVEEMEINSGDIKVQAYYD